MAYKSLLIGISILTIGLNSANALTPFSDAFSATSLNTTRWSLQNGGTGKLRQATSRINYTATSPATDDDYSIMTLRANRPGYNESWKVILDVTNTSGKGDSIGVGISIANAADLLDSVNLEFYGAGENGGFNFIGITDDYDNYLDDVSANPGITKGSMKVAYNGTTKLFTFWYDVTGSQDGYQWVRLCSFSPTGVGGTKRGNWNMGDTSGFRVRVFGYSELQVISGGKVFFDNFKLASGI